MLSVIEFVYLAGLAASSLILLGLFGCRLWKGEKEKRLFSRFLKGGDRTPDRAVSVHEGKTFVGGRIWFNDSSSFYFRHETPFNWATAEFKLPVERVLH